LRWKLRANCQMTNGTCFAPKQTDHVPRAVSLQCVHSIKCIRSQVEHFLQNIGNVTNSSTRSPLPPMTTMSGLSGVISTAGLACPSQPLSKIKLFGALASWEQRHHTIHAFQLDQPPTAQLPSRKLGSIGSISLRNLLLSLLSRSLCCFHLKKKFSCSITVIQLLQLRHCSQRHCSCSSRTN
jgi:hypothetical protein